MAKDRSYYKEKFEKFMGETMSYVPQQNETFTQIEECDYYFYSNRGYMFSAWGSGVKMLKPYKTGRKGTKQNGDPKRQNYEWKTGFNVHLRMADMAEKYAPNKFVTESIPEDSEEYDNHHQYGHNMAKSPQEINRADHLQQVPHSIHLKFNKMQMQTVEDVLNDQPPSGIPHFAVKSWKEFLDHLLVHEQPYMLVAEYDLNSGECKRTYAENLEWTEAKEWLSQA